MQVLLRQLPRKVIPEAAPSDWCKSNIAAEKDDLCDVSSAAANTLRRDLDVSGMCRTRGECASREQHPGAAGEMRRREQGDGTALAMHEVPETHELETERNRLEDARRADMEADASDVLALRSLVADVVRSLKTAEKPNEAVPSLREGHQNGEPHASADSRADNNLLPASPTPGSRADPTEPPNADADRWRGSTTRSRAKITADVLVQVRGRSKPPAGPRLLRTGKTWEKGSGCPSSSDARQPRLGPPRRKASR